MKLTQVRHIFREHIHFVFFILAVFANYLPDLPAYYLRLISGSEIEVAGSLLRYRENCSDPPIAGWKCRVQYRIPNHLIAGREAIGLGVIVFANEVYCADDSKKRIQLTPRDRNVPTADYLKTYLVFDLANLQCRSDLIVSNWSEDIFARHGYSQGAVTVGSKRAVAAVKKLTELSIVGLITGAIFLFIVLYAVFETLGKISGLRFSFPPFDQFKFVWIAFLVLISGNFVEIFFPHGIPRYLSIKSSNFFGMLAIGGPTLAYLAQQDTPWAPLRNTSRIFVNTKRWGIWPLVAFVFACVMQPYFRSTYAFFLFGFSSLGLLGAAIKDGKKSHMVFFALSGIVDSLKVLMVPHFPGSRVTAIYVVLVLAFEFFRHIRLLERVVAFNAGTALAREVAHDIRSPLSSLKILLPRFKGSTEEMEIAQLSLGRLSEIADDVLARARKEFRFSSPVGSINLVPLVSEVFLEKKLSAKDLEVELSLNVPETDILARISPLDFSSALSNLIANSIEAASAGGRTVSIEVVRASTVEVQIRISDSGKGISSEVLRNMGVKGLTTKADGQNKGNGLGFFLARQKVEQMNGKIEVRSQLGRGTTVTVTLPLES